jgi:hypothetical protein
LGGVFWKWLRLARISRPPTCTGPPIGRTKVSPSGAATIQWVGACMKAWASIRGASSAQPERSRMLGSLRVTFSRKG